MDEAEVKVDANAAPAQDNSAYLRAEAEEELRRMKDIHFMDLFSFNKFVFPKIARFLFLLYCICIVIASAVGFVGGLVVLFRSPLDGLLVMFASVAGCVFMFLMTRIWFELVLVGFKLFDHVSDIRELMLKK